MRVLFSSVIIAFFIVFCLQSISGVVSEGVLNSRRASGFNALGNNTICSCSSDDGATCLIVSAPALINGEPVRVCRVA